ncbi:MAG: hypothetical protein ACTHJ4_01650 [Candidatus Nucleicultricaceae bacterium]
MKFDQKPDEETRIKIRELGLKWNAIRGEWQGYVDVNQLHKTIPPYLVEIIDTEILSL